MNDGEVFSDIFGERPKSRRAGIIVFLFRLLCLIVILVSFFRQDINAFLSAAQRNISFEVFTGEIGATTIVAFIVVGFLAQLVDGALGMAYGVTSTTFLLSVGVTPAIASASVHAAEVFTTAISGISHLKLGNVDKEIFRKLVVPGVIGAIIGAYILTALPGEKLKPYVSAYLLLMGMRILLKARDKEPKAPKINMASLGFVGGFLDSLGGGGWGPVVTTTLVEKGHTPRFTIGSVNAAEFFIAIASSATFFVTIGLQSWKVIAGLIIGGALAAPIAAFAIKMLPEKHMLTAVGILISLLSVRTILLSAF